MIIKSYEANKSNLEERSIILLYGKNEGLKKDIIDLILNDKKNKQIKTSNQ